MLNLRLQANFETNFPPKEENKTIETSQLLDIVLDTLLDLHMREITLDIAQLKSFISNDLSFRPCFLFTYCVNAPLTEDTIMALKTSLILLMLLLFSILFLWSELMLVTSSACPHRLCLSSCWP